MITEPTITARLAAVVTQERYGPQLILSNLGYPESFEARIDPQGYRGASGDGIPADQYYGFTRTFDIDPGSGYSVDWEAFEAEFKSGRYQDLIERIREGAERHWNGSNYRCRLSEDAEAAMDELIHALHNEATLEATCWTPEEWFQGGAPVTVTAESTDEELSALAQELQDCAGEEQAVLKDLPAYLAQLRDETRDLAEVA